MLSQITIKKLAFNLKVCPATDLPRDVVCPVISNTQRNETNGIWIKILL